MPLGGARLGARDDAPLSLVREPRPTQPTHTVRERRGGRAQSQAGRRPPAASRRSTKPPPATTARHATARPRVSAPALSRGELSSPPSSLSDDGKTDRAPASARDLSSILPPARVGLRSRPTAKPCAPGGEQQGSEMRHIRPQIGEERDSAWVQLGDRRGQHAKSRNAEHIWVWEIEILCVAGRRGMGGICNEPKLLNMK